MRKPDDKVSSSTEAHAHHAPHPKDEVLDGNKEERPRIGQRQNQSGKEVRN